MKIDDGTLNRYLIKNLQSLTEADPSLLANYVAALLRNNKPKKELQKLCIDQLYDFLGDGTKSFVAKLFHALEDGTVPSSTEEMEPSKAVESGSVVSGTDVVELRTSSPQLERLHSTAIRAFSDEGEDESSDDEDDDRNHKHRRRVTRSRSFDRDGEEEDRGMYRKRGRSTDNGQGLRDNERLADDRGGPGHAMHSERDSSTKFDRRLGREHGSGRFIPEGGQRGNLRTGPQFRGEGPGPRFDGPNGMMRGGMGRGRGLGGSWPPHDQRFPPPPFSDGSEFAPPLLPPGPPTSGFFPGRGIPGRGVPHTPWPGYGPHPGMGNGLLEHAHPMSGGIQGGRGPPPLSAGIGLNMSMGRPRCLDFEERGYCLRGDLCPMEHGANRIVVEDVQSLSKFNLPVSIPSGRGMGIGPVSGPSPGPMLPPGLGLVNRGSRGSRENSSPAMGEDAVLLNGAVPTSAGAEPDLYDPDQPLWNKERPDASAGLRKLPAYHKGTQDPDWGGDLVEKRESREGSETVDAGRAGRGGSTNGTQGTESGPSVWDRIGPVDRVGIRLDGGSRSVGSTLEGLHGGKLVRKDGAEDMPARGRGVWQGKWNRDVEADEENVPRVVIANSTTIRGRGGGRIETGSGPRSGEGTSYGARGAGRGSSGFGSERAQRTLYVSFIPVLSNRTELLTAHFQKFGHVLDIRIPAHSDRAFVQFSRREDAEAALTAPDAVMGNRFIRLSWANRDSIPDPGDNMQSSANKASGKSGPVTTAPAVKPPEKPMLNGSASSSIPLEAAPLEGAGKAIAVNGFSNVPAITGAALKKQEELEKMREAIRKKQESLAQKRVDFRRKLEAKLAKQGSAHGDGSDSEHSAKRQKLEDAEENSSGPLKQGVLPSTQSQSSPSPAPQMAVEPSSSGGLLKTSSGEVSKQATVTGGVNQPAQPSPRAGRVQNIRANSTNLTYPPAAWGPARFKIDNRTTTFRVQPPFPSAVTEVAVLKEHFAMFGELSCVEVEDAEGQKVDGVSKLSEINSVRVSFATRRSAERAYVQGRWLQGQNLQLVWITSVNNPAGSGGAAGSSSFATPRALSAGPAYAEQEGANGNRYSDRETTKSSQENRDTATDADVLAEEASNQVSREEKSSSISLPNLEWRRENALTATKVAGRSSGGPGISTESGVETLH